MLLLFISFIAGVLTVLAPCILPLLPVIIGGSLSGEDKKAQNKKVFTIVISLGISVVLFTILLKVSTLFINIPEDVWKWISGGIIVVIGIIMLFPKLYETGFMARLSAKSNIALGRGAQKKGFWGDVIIGAALGPVFSTCSPTYFIVLATVLPASPLLGVVYLLSYVIGLCISLFIIAFLGQKIMNKLNIAADPKGWLKRTIAILFLIVGMAIISGVDKKLQTQILDSGFFDITKVEQKLLQSIDDEDMEDSINDQENSEESQSNFSTKEIKSKTMTIDQKRKKYKIAPEISSPDGFINTDGKPITLADLRGKVVLLDIWTYSCINCQRTLPYINEWHDKYKDDGLVIIGLHTPEFAFEKVQKNVEEAVKRFGIEYPVVLDNDYSTWNAYGNRYWPRKYLIDVDGFIIYDHIGEGGYDETERAIQKALKEINTDKSYNDTSNPESVINVDNKKLGSPEIYFGASRNSHFINGESGKLGIQKLTIPSGISLNKLYLGGTWNFTNEYVENKNAGSIVFKYVAKNVYFVAGSNSGVEADIYQDGKFIKTISIKEETLYHLIEDKDYGEHTLEIKVKNSGLQAFTFTFG